MHYANSKKPTCNCTPECVFAQPQVQYLGFILSEDGIFAFPDKVKAVRQYPTPKSVNDVRAILELAAFYRRLVPNFATVSKSHHCHQFVVYVGMGLDFHQILYRQLLWVKCHIAFRWVVLCCHQSDYLSDKRDSKTIK